MPDSTVDNLTTSGALAGTEKFYADNGVNDVEVTATQIKTFTNASIPSFPLSVPNGGSGATTSAEMIGENIQACSDDTTPDRIADRMGSYDSSADTGKGIPPWAVAGMAVLATGALSAQATLDIPLDTTGYSNFKNFKLILTNIVPVTDAANLYLRISDDGGSTFEADASDYAWVNNTAQLATTPSAGSVGDGADAQVVLLGTVDNVAGDGACVEIMIFNPAATTKTWMKWEGTFVSGSGAVAHITGGGRNLVASAVTDIRILFSTGNISTGNWTLIGII